VQAFSKDFLGFGKCFLGFCKYFLGFCKLFFGDFVCFQGVARDSQEKIISEVFGPLRPTQTSRPDNPERAREMRIRSRRARSVA
jgi:hypothetical protein